MKQFLPTIPGKALEGHVLKNITVEREGSCEIHCYREHNCQSYNVIPLLPAEGWLCQLNNADEQQHPGSLKSKTGYKYRATKVMNFTPTSVSFSLVILSCVLLATCHLNISLRC